MQGEPHRDGACAWWPSPNGVPVTCRCLRRHAEAGQERQVVWLVDAVAATAAISGRAGRPLPTSRG
jgi:hypothetical protein